MKKYSILTCLFGNYERLQEVKDYRDDVEYICITDNRDLTSVTWEIKMADKFILSLPFVNQWTYIRYHPFEFVNTDVCLYIDASVEIVKDVTVCLMEPFINSEKEYGVLIHPWRRTINEENNAWVTERGYGIENVQKINKWLCDNKYNVNGLIQSTIILQKNTQMTSIINNRTWELCHQWSVNVGIIDRNNQCDLTYIINTLFYDSDKIDFYSIETIKSDYLRWKVHDGTYYEWDGKNSAVVFDKENFGKKI